MKCKFCNEEMPERGNFCPICGGDNSFEPETVYIDPDDLVMEVEELVEEEGEAEILVTPDESEETEEMHFEPSPQLKRARLTSAIFGCVAALTVLALVLFAGIKGEGQVRRVSAYAYQLDATRPAGAPIDLSFLRS